jgi:hypothetical protein
MRRVTKRFIAGLCVLALVAAVASGLWGQVPLWVVVERAALAVGIFAVLGFVGGLLYEKVWLR